MRRIIAAILALAALTSLPAEFAPAAFADGDPASDVLTVQPVFNPPDSGVSRQQAAELNAVVVAANRAGYPIRVALINSSGDLGSITNLWGNANGYSQFLGRELSYVFHGATLVVMPQTDGLYVPVAPSKIPAGDTKAMTDLNPAGDDLAGSAMSIVRHLAADNGVQLPAKFAVALPSAARGSGSPVPIVAFAAGLVLVLLAWGASLRLRPLARKRAVA